MSRRLTSYSHLLICVELALECLSNVADCFFFFSFFFFFLMIRRPPRSTLDRSSAASDVYKRQVIDQQIVHNYSEKVRLFTYEDFKLLCKNYFDIIDVFGDYQLNTKHIDSPRMILVLSKINTL